MGLIRLKFPAGCSDITIITIYQLLSVCRADNRDSIVLMFA
jgi:hypothetical protein